jgi:hypothetical protein
MEEKKVEGAIPASSGTQTAKPATSSKPATAAPTPKATVQTTPPAGTKPVVAPSVKRQTPPPVAIKPAANPAPVNNTPKGTQDPKKLLRQKLLNTIVQKRIGETRQSIFTQLGVKNNQELTALLEKVKGYEDLNSKFYNLNTELTTLKAEKVAISNGVRQDKLDDLLTFLKGKGLDYTPENIQQVAQSHPEWLTQPEAVKPATIGKVGQQTQPVTSDIEKARNLFPSLRKK